MNLQRNRSRATLAGLGLLLALLGGCGSAPPAPPRQIQEYARHTSVGFEKHTDGQIGEARKAFQRALARAELDDDSRLIASALLNLGATELLLDLPDEAGRAYARASREARLANDAGLDWLALSGLAEATRRLGHPVKALELFAARPPAAAPSDDRQRLPAEIARARALADGGQVPAAISALEPILVFARQRPAPDPILAAGLHARAEIALASSQLELALNSGSQALEIDRQLHHPPSVATDHFLLGRIAASQNDNAKARHHFGRALAIFANTGQDRKLAGTRSALQALSAEGSTP